MMDFFTRCMPESTNNFRENVVQAKSVIALNGRRLVHAASKSPMLVKINGRQSPSGSSNDESDYGFGIFSVNELLSASRWSVKCSDDSTNSRSTIPTIQKFQKRILIERLSVTVFSDQIFDN